MAEDEQTKATEYLGCLEWETPQRRATVVLRTMEGLGSVHTENAG